MNENENEEFPNDADVNESESEEETLPPVVNSLANEVEDDEPVKPALEPEPTSAVVVVEGIELQMMLAIAKDDTMLRRALSAHYPDAANATFTRTVTDGVMRVNVQKRAGSKGAGSFNLKSHSNGFSLVLDALMTAPSYLDPALVLSWRLARTGAGMSLEEQMKVQPEIEKAISVSTNNADEVRTSGKTLLASPAIPSPKTPLGF